MDRVEEIEAAIDRLPPDEFRRIARWLLDRDQRDGMNSWTMTLALESSTFCSKKQQATGLRRIEIRRNREILEAL